MYWNRNPLSGLSVCSLLILFFQGWSVNSAGMVSMKVVHEPKTYSWQQPNFNAAMSDRSQLKMRINPSPFSGPPHLQVLANRCFNKTIGKYMYTLCPYSNLTQIEQDVYWNPYMGILGVWNGWVIKDNQFVEMKFIQGDQCGVAPRESRVVLSCGETSDIISVTEYGHCKYRVNFSTSLVCHDHSMLVYPTLSDELRHEWDILHTELYNEEITPKGYDVELNKLLDRAGLLSIEPTSSAASADPAPAKPVDQERPSNSEREYPFNDVHTCNQEYDNLRKRLDELEKQQNQQSQDVEPDLHELHN